MLPYSTIEIGSIGIPVLIMHYFVLVGELEVTMMVFV